MPHREWRHRIEHILEAASKVKRYTEGMTFDDFVSDDKTIDAVIRNFQVIGEAARHVPSEVVDRYPMVPWSQMRGMRHVIVHGYASVRLETVWETLRNDLPSVVPVLQEILSEG